MSALAGGLIDRPAPARPARDGGGSAGGGGHGGGGGGGPGDGAGPAGRDRGLPLSNARLLTLLALCASTMLFSGLIGAFMVLRGAAPQWPPAGSPPLPDWVGWNTVVVLASSATLAVAHVALHRGARRLMAATLYATTLLAIAFLAVQWFGWQRLREAGFLPRSNNYGGNFWLLTSVHFAHAVAGALLLVRASVLALRGYLKERLATPVEVAAFVWHFVDLAWLVIFATLLP